VPAAGTPASAAASGAPDQAAASGAEAPAEGYVYHSLGRRDPFVSLLHRGTDAERGVRTTDGLGTLGVGDVALKGIIHSEGVFVAMVQAPDRRTYVVRPNDQLRDARVKAITADEVVFLQHVTDPLSIVTEREVRKPLRPSEEGK
jgi:Tfp pilus assembly protein PilP